MEDPGFLRQDVLFSQISQKLHHHKDNYAEGAGVPAPPPKSATHENNCIMEYMIFYWAEYKTTKQKVYF